MIAVIHVSCNIGPSWATPRRSGDWASLPRGNCWDYGASDATSRISSFWASDAMQCGFSAASGERRLV